MVWVSRKEHTNQESVIHAFCELVGCSSKVMSESMAKHGELLNLSLFSYSSLNMPR